jgi:hypothetical protein
MEEAGHPLAQVARAILLVCTVITIQVYNQVHAASKTKGYNPAKVPETHRQVVDQARTLSETAAPTVLWLAFGVDDEEGGGSKSGTLRGELTLVGLNEPSTQFTTQLLAEVCTELQLQQVGLVLVVPQGWGAKCTAF